MNSKLFSQHPQLAALVWGTTPIRMHEKYDVPTRVPLRTKYSSELPPCTQRQGLFHEA